MTSYDQTAKRPGAFQRRGVLQGGSNINQAFFICLLSQLPRIPPSTITTRKTQPDREKLAMGVKSAPTLQGDNQHSGFATTEAHTAYAVKEASC